MASPAQDLLDSGRRLRQSASAPLLPDEQAAVGTTAGVLRNMPTAMPSPYAPGVAPKPGAPGQVVDLKPAAPQGVVGRTTSAVANAPRAGSNALMQGIRNPGVLGAGGTALAAAPEALRVGDVFANPKATWNDVGTQAAEGVGRIGAAGAGAAGGAVLGSVLGPVGAGIGGVAGGLYGYWAGDKAIRSLRGAAGVDPRSPAEQLGAPVAQTRVQGFTGEKPTIATAPTTPTASAAPSIRQPFSDVRNGTYGEGAPDLTGKILRDGNSYSGKDVKFGAEIVNPRNPGVGVSSLDTSEGYRQNLLELQRNAANAQAPGGVNGIGPRGGGNVFDDLRAKANAQGGGPLAAAMRDASPRGRLRLAEVMNANAEAAQTRGLQGEIAEAQTGATLRGQDITAGTSRANTRDTVGASLRGQDMDYAEKMDAKRLVLLMRQSLREGALASFTAARGNAAEAARLEAAQGRDPNALLAVAGQERAAAEASGKALKQAVEPSSIGPDGKISEGMQALNRNAARKAITRLDQRSPEEIAAMEPTINAVGTLRNNFNSVRRDGLLQRLGWDSAPPELSELPNLRGYTAGRLGKGANWNPTHDAKQGDYEFTNPGKPTVRLRADGLDSHALGFLRDQYGIELPR